MNTKRFIISVIFTHLYVKLLGTKLIGDSGKTLRYRVRVLYNKFYIHNNYYNVL
jgi:hypothetical protein